MPKRIYQIGEPCDSCQTPAVQGKNGAYCKPCYIAWAEAQKQSNTKTPVPAGNDTQANFDPLQADLQVRVAELELYRANMRTWCQKLADEVKSLRILVEEVAGKAATDLHVSLQNRDITESKTPSIEEAAKIVDNHKEEIPVIDALPEGFEK